MDDAERGSRYGNDGGDFEDTQMTRHGDSKGGDEGEEKGEEVKGIWRI